MGATRKRERHGESKTRLYKVWCEMWNRATNPKHQNAEYYFDKGITVCDEWKSYLTFKADMGERPDGAWLERVDNELGYYKENCKWESPSRQCSNRGRKTNTSGRLGVYWSNWHDKWRAIIKVDKKRIHLGHFDCFETACEAVAAAEALYLGYDRTGFV